MKKLEEIVNESASKLKFNNALKSHCKCYNNLLKWYDKCLATMDRDEIIDLVKTAVSYWENDDFSEL